MRRYRKWALTLGIIAVTPGIAAAGPFSFLKPKSAEPKAASPEKKATLSAKKKAENQRVAQEIAAALRGAKLNGQTIDIRYNDGVAQLTGRIGSAQQKATATEIVRRVRGVKRVDNQLRPFPGPASTQPVTQPVIQAANRPLPAAVNKAPVPPANRSGVQRTAGFEIQPQLGAPSPAGRAAMAKNPRIRPQQRIAAADYQQPTPAAPPGPAATGFQHPGPGAAQVVYNNPNFPEYAWPSYASYPNYAGVTYPTQYSASAWPYIGPFYPYPQVPLGWRQAQLEWDDGFWHLNFRPRTDRWWWFLHPKNW